MASPDAASWAADHGYKNVYCFRGGIPEWIKAGYEVVSVEKLPKTDIPPVSPDELEKLLASGGSFTLLDLRPSMESAKLWIDSDKRLQLPFEEIDTRFNDVPKGKKLIIVDVNGKRAPVAGRFLAMKGFSDIVRLDGGMNAWVSAGKKFKKGN